MPDEPADEDLEQPSHVWVKRTIYKKGEDSKTDQQLVHFEEPADEASIVKAFISLLIDYGQELGLSIFAPIHMDVGRWVIESEQGFSVIEIDPAWTEEQLDALDEAAAVQLDTKVWGGIFSKEVLPNEGNREGPQGQQEIQGEGEVH